MRRGSLTLLLALLVGGASRAQDSGLAPYIFDSAARALVQLKAEGCPKSKNGHGGERLSQGFVLGDSGEILTVRHAVAGCKIVTVQLFDGKELHLEAHRSTARAVKFRSEADLVLLQLENMPPQAQWPKPLSVSGGASPNAELFVIARLKPGIPSPSDKRLRVANGARQLRHIVDDETRAELESTRSPSLDLEIVKLDNVTITPGTSGAPIVDAAGRLVAIADGGLDGGLTQLTWAIPATEVERLLSSSETAPDTAGNQTIASQFSAEFETRLDRGTSFACGARQFTHIRTMRFDDLLATSDDPVGGLELISDSQVDHTETRFDIYQDLDSGAAFAVPEGGTLTSTNGVCWAQFDEGHVSLALWTSNVSSDAEMDQVSIVFEQLLLQGEPMMLVPEFSYNGPRARDDGLIVNRKAFMRIERAVLADGSELPLVTGLLFETLVGRGDTFVGYATFIEDGDQPGRIQQVLEACQEGGLPQKCAVFSQQVSSWEQALLAVHLTTFPRN